MKPAFEIFQVNVVFRLIVCCQLLPVTIKVIFHSLLYQMLRIKAIVLFLL